MFRPSDICKGLARLIFVRILSLLWLACVAFAAYGQTLAPDVIYSRFARIHSANGERAAELRRLFGEAGCDGSHFAEQKILSSKHPNLICVLPGSSKETVVVGAHFDNRGPGLGAVDNWSGASLLPSLYESLRDLPHRLTFEFIGFTDEERGLIGSRDYAAQLSKEHRAQILLALNIDSLGLAGPIRVWANRTEQFLLSSAALVSDRTKVKLGAIALSSRYDSDAAAFIAWKIPVIDFHSLTTETLSLLHSKRDVPAAVDAASYYNHYRFLAAFLAYLDENVESGGAK